MQFKTIFLSALATTTALTAGAVPASPFYESGLAVSAFETARLVRESADARMTKAVTDKTRADGGSIWLDFSSASDEADTMLSGAGYESDLAALNLGADIRLGEAFFGVVYTYARADTESRGTPNKADGDGDLFGITAFGQRGFGPIDLSVSAGWLYLSGDVNGSSRNFETNANLWTFDAAARIGLTFGPVDLVPYAKVEYTLWRPTQHPGSESGPHNANIWQFPIGVNAAAGFTLPGGSVLRPQIDLAVIRTAGDTQVDAYEAGELYSETLVGEHTVYRGMLGVAWTSGKGALSAGYRYLGSRQGRESHVWQLKADYVF